MKQMKQKRKVYTEREREREREGKRTQRRLAGGIIHVWKVKKLRDRIKFETRPSDVLNRVSEDREWQRATYLHNLRIRFNGVSSTRERLERRREGTSSSRYYYRLSRVSRGVTIFARRVLRLLAQLATHFSTVRHRFSCLTIRNFSRVFMEIDCDVCRLDKAVWGRLPAGTNNFFFLIYANSTRNYKCTVYELLSILMVWSLP